MSEDKTELVRKANDAINRGDRAAFLETMDPDVVMIPAREWPENSPTRGADALWDFYADVRAAWEDGYEGEIAEMVEAGDERVVANSRVRSHGRVSGAAFDFSYWFMSTFRNGRAIRIEWFSDRDEAIQAAGLSQK